MAYVVPRRSGNWEIRRSTSTPAGPRSRTLASFRVLDEGVIDRAIERAGGDLDADEIRAAARRAGAPVAREPVLAAAADLLARLARGARLPPAWRRALCDLVEAEGKQRASEGERAAAAWVDATAEDRGRALWDLLLLADRIPARPRSAEIGFPPLRGVA